MADQTLDASGLNCPMPILKTKKTLNKMSPGQILDVISTDAGSVKDMQAFCIQTGNKLIKLSQVENIYMFSIKKA
jgi:tRNA 2-thiouridine synthesizing protein A